MTKISTRFKEDKSYKKLKKQLSGSDQARLRILLQKAYNAGIQDVYSLLNELTEIAPQDLENYQIAHDNDMDMG